MGRGAGGDRIARFGSAGRVGTEWGGAWRRLWSGNWVTLCMVGYNV